MTTSFSELTGTMLVAEALARLLAPKVSYGVVVEPESRVPIVLDSGTLSAAAGRSATVGALAATLPWHVPVAADQPLEGVILENALAIAANDRLAGIVVVDDKRRIVGVIPRGKLADAAVDLIRRGGESDVLEGLPVLTGVIFTCEEDGEKRVVTYYDPSDPPRCNSGHLMKRGELAPGTGR
jgi:hypothetical protein